MYKKNLVAARAKADQLRSLLKDGLQAHDPMGVLERLDERWSFTDTDRAFVRLCVMYVTIELGTEVIEERDND